MDGGLLGSVGRAKERKRAALAREAKERAERQQRRQQRLAQQHGNLIASPEPGMGAVVAAAHRAGPQTEAACHQVPRLLAPAEVASLLADLNGGVPPSLEELSPVLLACGADATSGLLPAPQLTAVVVAWNRRMRERGLPGLGPSGGAASPRAGAVGASAGGGLCSPGCCRVS